MVPAAVKRVVASDAQAARRTLYIEGAVAQLPSDRTGPLLLSVVVPCFNEEASVVELGKRTAAALAVIPDLDYEVLYVDDGSQDRTLEILRGMQRDDHRVRVISLSRNFGQQAAITAGMARAGGDVLVVLDADLQYPPEVIAELVDRWRGGADVVAAVRAKRRGEPAPKRFTSWLFYRLLNWLSDVEILRDVNEFGLIGRNVINAVLAMPERHRLLRGMLAWAGFRREFVRFEAAPRYAGKTKYRLPAMIRLALDGIYSFSLLPLRIATWLGFASVGLGLLAVVDALATRFFADGLSSAVALFVAVLLVGGAQLVAVGILGGYLGRVYGEVKQRPMYLVREEIGFPPSDDGA